MTLKASPLSNRSVRRTCGGRKMTVSTLKEYPYVLLGVSF